MRIRAIALAAALLIAACSKVTQENFARIEDRDAVITVRFVNGKVALKTFDRRGAPQK